MKRNKKIVAALYILFFVISTVFVSKASVVYRDINSISIRTNFNFDYESIRDSGIPELDYRNSYEDIPENGIYISDNAKYEIQSCEWYAQGDNEFEIGGMPRIVVYLVTKGYDDVNPGYNGNNEIYYRFLSSYSSSTCYIANGTFVSASRLSTSNLKVVFQLKGLKGTFNEPDNAYWESDRGIARWDSPNVRDSGYYDIVLYREQSVVARVEKYHGNSYNFSGYFTKEGSYSFKVRTVAGTDNQATYGKSSEFTESGGLSVDAAIISMIASGGGVSTSNSGSTNVGWIQMNNTWYFYRPDGTAMKNSWVSWQNNWYYLDERGEMKVGLQDINNRTYYLGTDGTMITGWLNLNDTYYYFDTTTGDNYGAMLLNSWIKYDNKYFYFDQNGIMVTGWKQIGDSNGNLSFYYFYPKGTTQGLYGFMATNTTINGFNVGSDGRWIQS